MVIDPFHLPSLQIVKFVETTTTIEIEAQVITRLEKCPKCGAKLESKGRTKQMTIWDTPMGGKHVRYKLEGRRYKCLRADCGTSTDRGADVHSKHGMTKRLHRYIQSLALKSSIMDISKLTGATKDQVWPVVMDLAIRLRSHKFDTPPIVAIDDIRFGKPATKRFYTVISDGKTGKPISMVEALKAKAIGIPLHDLIDTSKVQVFVSDMAPSNVKLANSSFRNIPHVADKWHILDKMQKALSQTINRSVNTLNMDEKASGGELKKLKPRLLGKFDAQEARKKRSGLKGADVSAFLWDKDAQGVFNFETRLQILKANPDVRLVFIARLLLRHFYRASNKKTAANRFDRFLSFCKRPDMPEVAATAAKNLEKIRVPILAYFDVMWKHHDGRHRGPTTNLAETRNGKIKAMWKASRGVSNPDFLNMRVVFEPYVLGLTLIICELCDSSEILEEKDGINRAAMSVTDPRAHMCSSCFAAHPFSYVGTNQLTTVSSSP